MHEPNKNLKSHGFWYIDTPRDDPFVDALINFHVLFLIRLIDWDGTENMD